MEPNMRFGWILLALVIVTAAVFLYFGYKALRAIGIFVYAFFAAFFSTIGLAYSKRH